MFNSNLLLSPRKKPFSLKQNTAFLTSAELITKILGLTTTIIIARSLTPTAYGQFNLAISFVWLFIFFTDFGLTTHLTKTIATKSRRQLSQTRTITVSKLALAAISLLLIYLTAILVHPHPLSLIMIFSLSMMASSLTSLFFAYFQGKQQMHLEALAKIVLASLFALLSYLFSKSHPSLTNFALAQVLPTFLILAAFTLSFPQLIHPLPPFSFTKLKQLVTRSWPFSATGQLHTLQFKLNLTLLGLLSPLHLGSYAAATVAATNLDLVFSAFTTPLLAHFSSNTNKHMNKRWLYKKYLVLTPTLVVSLILLSLVTKPIFDITIGTNYSLASQMFSLLLIPIFFRALNKPLISYLFSANQHLHTTKIFALTSLLHLILSFALIPSLAFQGSIISFAASELTTTLLLFLLLFRSPTS